MRIHDLLSFGTGAQALNVFGTSLAALLVTTVLKYLSKLRVFSDRSGAGRAERDAAHFDCLRVGIDLSLVGLGSYLSVVQLALEKVPHVAAAVASFNAAVVLWQVALLGLATLTTGLFESPAKSWKKGIFIPSFVGWASVWTSALVFYYITHKVS